MKFTFENKIKKYIKLIYSFPNYYKLFKEINRKEKNRCILIGTPIHGNLGDSLIAQQCFLYLKNEYEQVLEIPEFFYELFANKIVLSNEDIYICGGGWMGDLYEDELVIEDVIKRYPNNKKIILPQTVSFSNCGKYSSSLQLKQLLDIDNKTLICVREKKSYDFCIEKLKMSKGRCLLLPDMALLALKNAKNENTNSKKVIFSCRNDVEKCINDSDIESIKMCLKNKGFECVDSSTVISKKVIKLSKRDYFINSKIEDYSQAKLVITDRLHSMVFALLAGCKCIALDNSTHKVYGVYSEWLKDISGLIVLENSKNLTSDLIEKCLNADSKRLVIDYNKEFLDLKKGVDLL